MYITYKWKYSFELELFNIANNYKPNLKYINKIKQNLTIAYLEEYKLLNVILVTTYHYCIMRLNIETI